MRQRIKNWLLRHSLGAVAINDIASESKGILKLGGQAITEAEIRSLVSEVKAIESTRMWHILNETIKQKAFERGWLKSTTMEELNTAKTMFSTLELQSSLLKLIKKQEK